MGGMQRGVSGLMMISQQWWLTHRTHIVHQISGIDLSRFSKILNTHILFFADQNLIKLNFMICLYRLFNYFLNIFKFNDRWVLQIQIFNFDLPVQAKHDLLFILIILICNMICVLSYHTEGTSITSRNIVGQFSCMIEY